MSRIKPSNATDTPVKMLQKCRKIFTYFNLWIPKVLQSSEEPSRANPRQAAAGCSSWLPYSPICEVLAGWQGTDWTGTHPIGKAQHHFNILWEVKDQVGLQSTTFPTLLSWSSVSELRQDGRHFQKLLSCTRAKAHEKAGGVILLRHSIYSPGFAKLISPTLACS